MVHRSAVDLEQALKWSRNLCGFFGALVHRVPEIILKGDSFGRRLIGPSGWHGVEKVGHGLMDGGSVGLTICQSLWREWVGLSSVLKCSTSTG